MRRFALSLLMLSLTACDEHVVVTSVDTFCTRVERYHATEEERAALKANSGLLERFIRWAAGINEQYDKHCLKPSGTP
jgi:high-affinity nickel permease